MIKRTGQDDVAFTKAVYVFLQEEMAQSNLAIKSFEAIEHEIISGKAFIAINDQDEIVGYISFYRWQCGVEIMSLTVKSESRKQGWGSKLVSSAVSYLQGAFAGQEIIALANKNSKPILLKNGFCGFSKFSIADELRDACAGCQEELEFPTCHCQPLIFARDDTFRIIELTPSDVEADDMFDLYCRIWREEPWNEDFWTPAKVRADLETALKQSSAICLAALIGEAVTGFCWGFDVEPGQLRYIAGHDYFDTLYGRRIFYLAELGVERKCRGNRIGKKLTAAIINFAKNARREIIILRTDKNAQAAQALYKSFGFVPLMIPDARHQSRLYWALKLGQ